MTTPTEFWNSVKHNLKSKNSDNKLLQTYFEPTDLVAVEDSIEGKKFRLGVPTVLHKYWISENLFDRICTEISAIYKNPFMVELVVTGQNSNLNNDEMESPDSFIGRSQAVTTKPAHPTEDRGPKHDVLNPDYTFSTFVVGRNNEFAHAASYRVSENPGASEGYNPLFICGPTGMGKTHLLNAVGNYLRQRNPGIRITYVSAERFMNECISSIRSNEMDKFRLRYRERCDILLMDDIQILGRGEAVQEEFFNTLNHFFEKGRQVVVASDRMPRDIKGLEDRIRTRLEWGLIADIQMPDIETRVAILRYKAEKKGIRVPLEVINYIARISKRSIRELEGNLNKVKMFWELNGLEINLENVQKILANHDETTALSIEDIQKLVADHFKVRQPDLKSKTRTRPLVVARQMAMFLIKKHLDKSLVDIGRAFGGKDHTTVINALRRIQDQLTKDSDLKRDLEELENRIHNITGV